MEAQKLYQNMFCENCGKCNGENIKIVENRQERLKIVKCSLLEEDRKKVKNRRRSSY